MTKEEIQDFQERSKRHDKIRREIQKSNIEKKHIDNIVDKSIQRNFNKWVKSYLNHDSLPCALCKFCYVKYSYEHCIDCKHVKKCSYCDFEKDGMYKEDVCVNCNLYNICRFCKYEKVSEFANPCIQCMQYKKDGKVTTTEFVSKGEKNMINDCTTCKYKLYGYNIEPCASCERKENSEGKRMPTKWVADDTPIDSKNESANAITPNHYKTSSIECIEVLKLLLPRDEYIGFLKGNIIKYLWRCTHKNGLEDLDKAEKYVSYYASYLEDMDIKGNDKILINNFKETIKNLKNGMKHENS